MEQLFFKVLRMEGCNIFPYQSVYWNNIWNLDLVDPLWLIGSSLPTPLFFPMFSIICGYLHTYTLSKYQDLISTTNFITSPYGKIGKKRKIAKTERTFKYSLILPWFQMMEKLWFAILKHSTGSLKSKISFLNIQPDKQRGLLFLA